MGLTVDVLHRATMTKAPVPARYTLVDAAGPFEPAPDAPGLRLVKRCICGQEYVHAEPLEPCPRGMLGYMASGLYVTTCDSRLQAATGHPYPVPLHNRTEVPIAATQE